MGSKALGRELENTVRVRGVTSKSGNNWIKVRQGERVAYIPHGEFMTSPREAKNRLARGQIVLIGKDWSNLVAAVRGVRFRAKPLVERVGWTDGFFALPDCTVFGPSKTKPGALFHADTAKCSRAGTVENWSSDVAGLLEGQTLAMFMLMAALVAPLLKLTRRTGNFGFELVGPPGTGKSTLLYAMASVVGGAVQSSGANYWNTCNTTVNALERKALQHADLPLLLDDATGFAGEDGSAAKGNKFKTFVFNLAQAETKDRWDDAKGPQGFRLIYVLTANTPLAEVIANVARNEAGATADRLLTLDTGLIKHGTFDIIPAGYANSTEYARALIEALSAQHGTAMPAFLERLVEHRAADEPRLRAGIVERVNRFTAMIQADPCDASSFRVAEAFGLVMAAGELASWYGVLPKSYDCEAAAVSAYRLHQASTARTSYTERLLAYAADPRVIDMTTTGQTHLNLTAFVDAPGVFREGPGKEREFLVHPDTFRKAFPDWRRALNDREVVGLLRRERPHKTIKRKVTKDGDTDGRVFCFRLGDPPPLS